MLTGFWRDLALAARTLIKARAFTFVCVVSLGIGTVPVIAIPCASRLTTLTPPGVNTEELVELVTTTVGPHQQTEFAPWDLFVPLERHPRLLARTGAVADENFRGDRSKEWLSIHGRRSPGGSVQQATTAVAAVTAQLAKAYPATNEFKSGFAAAYDPLGTLLRANLWRLQAVASTLTGMVLSPALRRPAAPRRCSRCWPCVRSRTSEAIDRGGCSFAAASFWVRSASRLQ